MLRTIILITLGAFTISGCNNSKDNTMNADNASFCSDDCKVKTNTSELSCKLTSGELRERRETVIASLKAQVTQKQELKNGYAFKFPGSDQVLNELNEFIKTERECCDFFTFNLTISGDKSEAWLELTGAEGVKEFISEELGF